MEIKKVSNLVGDLQELITAHEKLKTKYNQLDAKYSNTFTEAKRNSELVARNTELVRQNKELEERVVHSEEERRRLCGKVEGLLVSKSETTDYSIKDGSGKVHTFKVSSDPGELAKAEEFAKALRHEARIKQLEEGVRLAMIDDQDRAEKQLHECGLENARLNRQLALAREETDQVRTGSATERERILNQEIVATHNKLDGAVKECTRLSQRIEELALSNKELRDQLAEAKIKKQRFSKPSLYEVVLDMKKSLDTLTDRLTPVGGCSPGIKEGPDGSLLLGEKEVLLNDGTVLNLETGLFTNKPDGK